MNWYRDNRAKWAGNVLAPDCEKIIDSIADEPAKLPAHPFSGDKEKKKLRLVRLVAHRFAGLHAYGTVGGAPEDFTFEPAKQTTLLEGWNGSGKTSLANAIIWCLTGQLLRPQRLPERGDLEFTCSVEHEDEQASEHRMSPVTPLPHVADWTPDASSEPLPVDTWVELTFEDEDGKILTPIRRSQKRKSNGKIEESASDPAELGVDPISFRLGTTMPGILQFLQVGSSSELGLAIAELTGLSELVELSKHATKVMARVKGKIAKDRQDELEQIEAEYSSHLIDLEQRIVEFPAMAPPKSIPVLADENIREAIVELSVHFERLKADGLANARQVLGKSFEPGDSEQRTNLEDCVGPAIEQLNNVMLLPSIERLTKLNSCSGTLDDVRDRLSTMRSEARTLAELAANPKLARRVHLYALVASWMVEHEETFGEKCAVCRNSLEGVIDPETDFPVADHLREIQDDSEIVSKTISQWASGWTGALARDLPEAVRGELGQDLPKSPVDLVQNALTEELFGTQSFSGALLALRPSVEDLVEAAKLEIPEFGELEVEPLPEKVSEVAGDLARMVEKIERVLGFIYWMEKNGSSLHRLVELVCSSKVDEAASGESIAPQLERLELIVKGVAPISAGILLAERMARTLENRALKIERINAGVDTVAALEEIVPVGELAQAQVEGLRSLLHGRAEYWRDQIYQSATTFAPRPQESDMNAQGVIDIQVGRGKTRAPAQHVSNASALRAGLMGFYLAFREHVLKENGGLMTLILDDPQDLLDYDNRQRLARALTKIAADGGQVIATTHDRSFARTLVAEGRKSNSVTHYSVHPVNDSRRTLETSLAVEELDRKRLAFINNPDNAHEAQDYANQARIYIEARLGDLFDDPAYPAHSVHTKAPTLVPLYDRLRALVSTRSNELFRSPVLEKFCNDSAMKSSAETRRVLNQSHHDKESISYGDVEGIDDDLKRLRTSIERVHEEFRRYRWREPLVEEPQGNVIPLVPLKAPDLRIPICEDIAAFTNHVPFGGDQLDFQDYLSGSWFADKALFYIRYDTLGFAIPAGSIAIVEAQPSVARDHSLVVARRGSQSFARRLLRPRNGEGFLLAAESPDPRKSRPTLAFEDHGIEIYRIVGFLFSSLPPPDGREEATKVELQASLDDVDVGYRVRDDSAVPLALPKQMILGGKEISTADFDQMSGEIVALTLDDGGSILKRVGAPISSGQAHLRQFETIGGLGSSAIIATETIEGTPDVPVISYARSVVGVLYEH